MFQIGDFIVYGNVGVCRVEKISTIDMAGIPKDRLYYSLVPVYAKGSEVFTPVENSKVVMRPVVSKEEALTLIENMEQMEVIWVTDDKQRESVFKEMMKSLNLSDCIKVMKTLYLRKQNRLAEGKKATAGDQKYLHLAEDSLYGELAVAFDMEKDEIEDFITKHLKLLKKQKKTECLAGLS